MATTNTTLVSTIQGNECIGDSLTKINGNFETLQDLVLSLQSRVNGIQASVVPTSKESNSTTTLNQNVTNVSVLCSDVYRDMFTGKGQGDGDNLNSAGDGMSIEYQQLENKELLVFRTTNTKMLVRPSDFELSPTSKAGRSFLSVLGDRSAYQVCNFPKNNNSFVNFNVVCPGKYKPALTIYWRTSAQNLSVPSLATLYATGSGTNVAPNNIVKSFALNPLDSTGRHAFLGGSFTKIGATAKNRVAFVDLSASPAEGYGYGSIGALSAVPYFPNANLNHLLSATTGGFSAGEVRKILSWTVGSDSYVAFAGDCVNTTTQLKSIGLIIFKANGTQMHRFSLRVLSDVYSNGDVYDIVADGADVYVAGRFNRVSVNGAAEVPARNLIKFNVVSGTLYTTFNDAIRSGIEGVVYTLAIDGTYLYAGGEHQTAANSKFWVAGVGDTNYARSKCLTIHNKETGVIVNDDNILRLYYNSTVLDRVEKLFIEDVYSGGTPQYRVLYVGGSFDRVLQATGAKATGAKFIIDGNKTGYTRIDSQTGYRSLAAFKIYDYTGTGTSFNAAPYLLDWRPVTDDKKIVWNITSPGVNKDYLIVSGNFTQLTHGSATIDKRNISNIAAITKPLSGSTIKNWDLKLNGSVFTATVLPSTSPANTITAYGGLTATAERKTTLLIGGSFTMPLNGTRKYFTRVGIPDLDFSQAIPTLSAFTWRVTGKSMENDGDVLDIDVDTNSCGVSAAVYGDTTFNVTRIPPLIAGFGPDLRTKLLRFDIARDPNNAGLTLSGVDNFYGDVQVVGVQLDFNTSRDNQFYELKELSANKYEVKDAYDLLIWGAKPVRTEEQQLIAAGYEVKHV